MNLRLKIQKLMYGRYGIDELYKFLFSICLILILLNTFIKGQILPYIELIIFVIMIYRCLSKKIYKRSNENQLYLKLKRKLLKPFANLKRNWIDRNDYIYRKCYHCKTTLKLRLPNKIGINHIKCPTCKKRITTFCLRKQKVIVKKNNK